MAITQSKLEDHTTLVKGQFMDYMMPLAYVSFSYLSKVRGKGCALDADT